MAFSYLLEVATHALSQMKLTRPQCVGSVIDEGSFPEESEGSALKDGIRMDRLFHPESHLTGEV